MGTIWLSLMKVERLEKNEVFGKLNLGFSGSNLRGTMTVVSMILKFSGKFLEFHSFGGLLTGPETLEYFWENSIFGTSISGIFLLGSGSEPVLVTTKFSDFGMVLYNSGKMMGI